MTRTLPATALTATFTLLAACAPDGGADEAMEQAEEAGYPAATETVEETEAVPSFEAYDLDDDGALSSDEFATWLGQAEVDPAWAYGTEPGLDADHVARRMVVVWDVEGDSLVSEDEWAAGITTWYGPDDYGAFVDWDSDGDSELDADEVAEVLETRGMYDVIDLDRDSILDDEELANWFFDVIDASDDDRIDATEWDAAMESGWIG